MSRAPQPAPAGGETLLDAAVQKKFAKKLLSWYATNGRHDMPWRKTADPYAVFVSEFMLQQTTVATVRPYYDRFLARFPTIESLASADINDVLALWSGLGYYARARNLWMAMKKVQEEHGGKIPSEVERLESLPGVGPYTAGAVASFGFNRPAAVLDGNVIRVLMRVLAIEDDPKMKPVQAVLKKVGYELAAGTIPPKAKSAPKKSGPRDFNLAIMDLGSTVCVPQSPRCADCPVADLCLAKKFGRQENIPPKGDSADRPLVRRLHAALSWEGAWLMGQRPKKGLFGGLWEFLGTDAPQGVEPVLALEESVLREIGLPIRVQEALPTFEHQLTHRVFLVRAFRCEPSRIPIPAALRKKSENYDRFRWVKPDDFANLGVSAVTKKIWAELRAVKSD